MTISDEDFAAMELRAIQAERLASRLKEMNKGIVLSFSREVATSIDSLVVEFRSAQPSLNRDGAIQALSMMKVRLGSVRSNALLSVDE